MRNELKTLLYILLCIGCVFGFFAFLLIYPFPVEPSAILQHDELAAVNNPASTLTLHADGTLTDKEGNVAATIDPATLQSIQDYLTSNTWTRQRDSYLSRYAQTSEDLPATKVTINTGTDTLTITQDESYQNSPLAAIFE